MQYAAKLLFVPGLAATKISILFFLNAITPVKWHKRVLRILGAAVGVWGLTAVFILAFQCATPSPWNYLSTQCLDRVCLTFLSSQKQDVLMPLPKLASEQYIAVLNIVTEIALVILPIIIVMPLKTAWSRRLTMVACFASRLL